MECSTQVTRFVTKSETWKGNQSSQQCAACEILGGVGMVVECHLARSWCSEKSSLEWVVLWGWKSENCLKCYQKKFEMPWVTILLRDTVTDSTAVWYRGWQYYCMVLWVTVLLHDATGTPAWCHEWQFYCTMSWMTALLHGAVGDCTAARCCGWQYSCVVLWVTVLLHVVGDSTTTWCHGYSRVVSWMTVLLHHVVDDSTTSWCCGWLYCCVLPWVKLVLAVVYYQ